MKSLILTLSLLTAIPAAYAHEGHEMPGVIKAAHGGIVVAGKEFNMEYMQSGTEIKLYPLPHPGDTFDFSKVKFTATAKAPKEKESELKLEKKENAFVTTVDFKKAYRLEIIVTSDNAGKKDKFKFQVEK
ncbi:MAG: hypothetical protein HUU57_06040 [Bdellovibrio sp.]|nr:hypothetical protein [Bdellovibrio sp.]